MIYIRYTCTWKMISGYINQYDFWVGCMCTKLGTHVYQVYVQVFLILVHKLWHRFFVGLRYWFCNGPYLTGDGGLSNGTQFAWNLVHKPISKANNKSMNLLLKKCLAWFETYCQIVNPSSMDPNPIKKYGFSPAWTGMSMQILAIKNNNIKAWINVYKCRTCK